MAEDKDKPEQDNTVQVSGSELEVLRQSAQLIAVNRDDVMTSAQHAHPLREETTLDLELRTSDEPADDDSTKAINRQSLVQIIKTEMREASPNGEVKQFGIIRREDKRARVEQPAQEDVDHSDTTQAIGKEQLKRLRESHQQLEPVAAPQAKRAPSRELQPTPVQYASPPPLEASPRETPPTQEAPAQAPEVELAPASAAQPEPAPVQAAAPTDDEAASQQDLEAPAPAAAKPKRLALILATLGIILLVLLGVSAKFMP